MGIFIKLIHDLYRCIQNKEPQIYDNLKSIEQDLELAIDLCLEAVGHQFDIKKQKTLLEAAFLGKSFLETYHSEQFVIVARTTRLLNQLSEKEIGMPLTSAQLSFFISGLRSPVQLN